MNMAVQALRSGDIKAAVVGGVSLLNTDVSPSFCAWLTVFNSTMPMPSPRTTPPERLSNT
jgi:acyl transferase domain-containing protein